MEIVEIISYFVNDSTDTIEIKFRLNEDDESELRFDEIELREAKEFGYQLADYDYLFVGRSSDELNASFLGRVGVKGSATGNLFAITGAPPSIRLQKVEPKQ